LDLPAVLIGCLVGCIVAATGIGGGVLLMPLLIIVLRVSPIAAVGTALLFMSGTKLWAVALHWRQHTVDFRLAGQLSLGSIPGAFAGAAALSALHARMGDGVNSFLRTAIGILLIAIPLLSIVLDAFKRGQPSAFGASALSQTRPEWKRAACIGLAGGFLVSATSVGSGSLIILLLLIWCRRPPVVLVGTDIFHAMILTAVATLIHLRMNPVNFAMAGQLLVGSLVGVAVGTRLSADMAPAWLRRTLLILAATGGLAML